MPARTRTRTRSSSTDVVIVEPALKKQKQEVNVQLKKKKGTTTKKKEISTIPSTEVETYPQLNYFINGYKPITDVTIFEEFSAVHNDEFIRGLKYILEKDPLLIDVVLKTPFSSYLKLDPNSTITTKKYMENGRFYFDRLVSGLISQQISGKAAKSIKAKIIDNLSTSDEKLVGRLPSPETFNSQTVENLRSLGLSMKKAEYVKGLAKAFMIESEGDNELKLTHEFFQKSSDELIDSTLQSFKGIGPWSSSMFMMFGLERMNIFEVGDLGIKRGLSEFLKQRPELLKEVSDFVKNGGLKSNSVKKKKPPPKNYHSDEVMELVANQFEPYKSIFMLIIWRISDITIDALE
ncbi:hypothetical protein CANARDRAFT_26141 [[Candida] arabinofermentans NRRL YB-2248]|uniref:HhH-GPD domain-containing protein n=1 Tax=[Candida] arabinofermentans NRRL YB-2248 TaxID=983967 RepID=A0A1E4T8B5_9ASCO|nr:hypothetical protein CANARDRAFT_26141 [[Candida] arabinofermentans NRRL YB-2248]